MIRKLLGKLKNNPSVCQIGKMGYFSISHLRARIYLCIVNLSGVVGALTLDGDGALPVIDREPRAVEEVTPDQVGLADDD